MAPLGRVLIIEDDGSIRLLLEAIVVRNRLEPVVAVDGLSAQALLAISKFDAILLDLRLPEIDGGTILHTLDRAMRRRVVIVTAAPSTVWRAYVEHGVWAVVQKPFDIAELEGILLACLANAAGAQESAGDQLATSHD